MTPHLLIYQKSNVTKSISYTPFENQAIKQFLNTSTLQNLFQRVRENETSLQQLSTEREERERERWSLLRHARDEAERSLSLAAQLNAKELQLQQAQEQLQEVSKFLVYL